MNHKLISSNNRKIFFLLTSIIGLHFLWNGSAYISQMYHLYKVVPPEQVDIIALRYNYFAQALGILAYSFTLRHHPKIAGHKYFYLSALAISAVSIYIMLYSYTPGVIIYSGITMNFLFGLLSAYQFTLLAACAPANNRARIFAFAYAFGTLGTFFISFFDEGQFLSSDNITLYYIVMIVVNLIIFLFINSSPQPNQNKNVTSNKPSPKVIAALIICLFIMSVINSVGANYKSAAVLTGIVNLALVRSFYAIGFILIGILSDKNRKTGAILCLVSLVFNFLAIFLHRDPSLIFAAWSLNYFLLSFYTVFRVIVFVDIAAGAPAFLPLAGLGLCIARLGEAASTYINNALHIADLVTASGITLLFSLLIFLFIYYYTNTYQSAPVMPPDETTRLRHFRIKHNLSPREQDVFSEILKGQTNNEIADKLFISESTVKFHIKNIFKKTHCKNRNDIYNLFYDEK